MAEKPSERITAATIPFLGFWHFIKRPSLWILPMFVSILSWAFMAVIFFFVVIWTWPVEGPLPINYTWGIVSAFCYAFVALFFVWAFILPVFLDFAFEKMVRKFLISRSATVVEKKHVMTLRAGTYVVSKTFLWRFIWLFVCFLSAILVPPISVLFTAIAFSHVAIVDGADVSLAQMGFAKEERISLIRERDQWFLLSGIIAGIISLIVLPTFIAWVFWLPSMYIGAALWCQNWGGTPSEKEEETE